MGRSKGWPVLVVLVAMTASARKGCARKWPAVEEKVRAFGALALVNAWTRGNLEMGRMHNEIQKLTTSCASVNLELSISP